MKLTLVAIALAFPWPAQPNDYPPPCRSECTCGGQPCVDRAGLDAALKGPGVRRLRRLPELRSGHHEPAQAIVVFGRQGVVGIGTSVVFELLRK